MAVRYLLTISFLKLYSMQLHINLVLETSEVYIVGIDAPAVVKNNSQLMTNWQAVRSKFGYSGPYTQNWFWL
ncbi:hypothetical protein QUA20_07560 [Microcoleus sp. Pol7_A1]